MIQIGQMSKYSGISIRMLRHYDSVGLFCPSYTDENTGYRYYTGEQFLQIITISKLKDMGFKIQEIKEVINANDSIDEIVDMKRNEIKENIRRENEKLELLNTILVKSDIKIKESQELKVISYRTSINKSIGQSQPYDKIFAYIHSIGASPSGIFTVYHDEEISEDFADIELCVIVNEEHEGNDQMVFKTIDKMKVVSSYCEGSIIANTNRTMRDCFDYIISEGLEVNGQARQFFYETSFSDKSQNKQAFEIQIPIK